MKIFASDFCEDDEAIQAYCKEDEQKDAEKIPPKAWFVLFPYSIVYEKSPHRKNIFDKAVQMACISRGFIVK